MNSDQINQIWEGWSNWLQKENLSDDQKSVAAARLQSCKACQYKQQFRINKIIDEITGRKEKAIGGFKCSICTCHLTKKVLCFSCECPLPEHRGEKYSHKKRWGKVEMDDKNNLIGGNNVYVTVSTSDPASETPA